MTLIQKYIFFPIVESVVSSDFHSILLHIMYCIISSQLQKYKIINILYKRNDIKEPYNISWKVYQKMPSDWTKPKGPFQ